ncbi:hypothetical protein F8388_010008 [Cannabis sativa]|uniref:TF-B3 domain-containing protein n=1 Tax=Cannabis sativa TaxID=3483 RepID=A0A7J6DSA5_CANSA|nr:hypothetical protein G4B88_025265 [Cannabis sativa]KAF4353849.1 hypothetical protein F8388_010008 [Cannabis sativa]
MHSKVKACAQCTRSCWLIHEGKPACSASSFLKIMFDMQEFECPFLPPKFVKELSLVAGQKAILEDAYGEQWDVRISRVKGSLAFEQGWSKFASDHDLELGDFVLFLHITETHLAVKIYDKTSCEKLKFPQRSSILTKRKRDLTTTSSGRSGPFGTADGNSIDRNGIGTSFSSRGTAKNVRGRNEVIDVVKEPIVSQNKSLWDYKNEISPAARKVEYIEETCCIMNREKEEEDQRGHLDLSVLETLNDAGSQRNHKESLTAERFPKLFDSQMRSQKAACLPNKDLVTRAQEILNAASPLHSSNCEKKGSFSFKDYSNVKTSGTPIPSSVVNPFENGKNTFNMSNKGTKECLVATAAGNNQVSQPKEQNWNNEHPTAKNHVQGTPVTSSKLMKITKEEPVEIESDPEEPAQKLSSKVLVLQPSLRTSFQNGFGVSKDDKVQPVVKTENFDFDGGPTPSFSPVLATNSKAFIELPERLPFPVVKGKYGSERKLVYLRSSSSQLWPVIYHEKLNVFVISNGWEAFCKANGIQPGDKCLFKVVSKSEGTYSVSVVRQ